MTTQRGEYKENHSLARYTSWRIGGAAERFYRPADCSDLQNFLSTLPADEPITWLGLGSNTLVRDGGVAGTVILTLNRLKTLTPLAGNRFYAEAGLTCAKLAKACVARGFERGAFFAGIPGTVGGALFMNAGAYGEETWTFVESVAVMNRCGVLSTLSRDAFQVAYRKAEGLAKDEWFAGATFLFPPGDIACAKAALKTLLAKRAEQQPIGSYSCGSVFRNPPGDFAARLIDEAGLKGKTIGGAAVSTKHANFILNHGQASASDVESLIAFVAQVVQDKTGIALKRECRIIG